MSETTADWIWQSLESERSVTVVTEEQIAHIRRLIAYWEPAETGAAGLADDDFLELYDAMEPDFEAALDVFMHVAELASFDGPVLNPYAGANDEQRAIIEDIPDRQVKAELLSGENIALAATADEIAVWTEANRQASGINPKRPFGTQDSSRDIRAIVDPDRKMPNAAFSKYRKQLESRMVLLLQRFVQNAHLEPGMYRRGEDWIWSKLQPDTPPVSTPLTRTEWVQRIYSQFYYESQDYVETLRCLAHLVWDNRLEGSYAALTTQFKLANHFDASRATYEGATEERLRAALKHFPEHRKLKDGRWWFTLTLMRLLNAQARFSEAAEVLKAAGVHDLPAKNVDLSTINPLGLLFLENIIARRGQGLFGDDEFQAILSGTHSQWRTESDLWSFVWKVLREPDTIDDPNSLGLPAAQSVAVQIEVMRGGYDPDAEVGHY